MGLQAFLLVGAGGACGAMARYGVGLVLKSPVSGFAWATFSVNIIGSLLMGLLFGWMSRHSGPHEGLRLLLGVGLLGGFTTFSAFSMDVLTLLEKRDFLMAGFYAGGSVLGGLLAFALAYMLVKAA